jgi:WD40 repeat protein
MRWPRARFTIRFLMLGVVIFAAIFAAGVRHLKAGRAGDLTIPGARAVLDGAEEEIRPLSFSADGETMVAVGRRGSVQLWDAGTARRQASLSAQGRFAYSLAISPDGRSVSIADSTGDEPRPRPRSLRFLRVEYGPFRLPNMGSIAIRAEASDPRFYAGKTLAFSPDGRLIASGGLRTVEIRARSTLRWRTTVGGPFLIPSRLAFSHDSKLLAVGDGVGCVALFDLDEGTPRFVRPEVASPRPIESEGDHGHIREITTLVFSCDGERLISLGEDNRVKVWDTTTGRLVNHVKIGDPSGWGDRRSVLAIVAAGKGMVTASKTGDVGLWDLDTGRVQKTGRIPLGPLVQPNYWLTELAISPDGKILAGAIAPDSRGATSQNSLIVLWDIEKLLVVPRRQSIAPLAPCRNWSRSNGGDRRWSLLLALDLLG